MASRSATAVADSATARVARGLMAVVGVGPAASAVEAAGAAFCFRLRFRSLERSMGAAVSSAVSDCPSLNHSRIVAWRPALSVDMWFLTLSIPSAAHFSMIVLLGTPSSFARM
jgi:hypothetical protein